VVVGLLVASSFATSYTSPDGKVLSPQDGAEGVALVTVTSAQHGTYGDFFSWDWLDNHFLTEATVRGNNVRLLVTGTRLSLVAVTVDAPLVDATGLLHAGDTEYVIVPGQFKLGWALLQAGRRGILFLHSPRPAHDDTPNASVWTVFAPQGVIWEGSPYLPEHSECDAGMWLGLYPASCHVGRVSIGAATEGCAGDTLAHIAECLSTRDGETPR